MDTFASKAGEYLRTAKTIAQVKGGPVSRVLGAGSAELLSIGFDNWDGGTDLYSFQITIPAKIYAEIVDAQDEIEAEILSLIRKIVRGQSGVHVTEVVLRPVAPPEDGEEPVVDPGLWKTGHFRLFLSHHSAKKEAVALLRDELGAYYISGFVAHTDIEPTREWETQIEAALRTMDALAAVISPEFLGSKWCDQEVGFAMGRQRLVLPLRAGADPHGFLGKYQGLQAKGRTAKELAADVFKILALHDASSRRLAEAVVEGMLSAQSWESARAAMPLLEAFGKLDRDLVERLRDQAPSNPKIVEAYTVPDRIERLVVRHLGEA